LKPNLNSQLKLSLLLGVLLLTACTAAAPSPTATPAPALTATAAPSATPTQTPVPTATLVPVPPEQFNASFQPLTGDDLAPVNARKYQDTDFILHSLPLTGTIAISWRDDDALPFASVYLDDAHLGEYGVHFDDQSKKYIVEIGSGARPFSLGLRETAILRVVMGGRDGGRAEVTITLTRQFYDPGSTNFTQIPREYREIQLGYDPARDGTGVTGKLAGFLQTREYLWDVVTVSIEDEAPISWRGHLGNPETLIEAMLAGQRVSVKLPEASFIVPAPFYTQFVSLNGLIIEAPPEIDPQALIRVKKSLARMFESRPELLDQLAELGAFHAIFAADRGVTSLPEYAYLKGTSYDDAWGVAGGRVPDGFSASIDLSALHDELAYVAIHELAHVVHDEIFTAAEREAISDIYWNALDDPQLAKSVYAFTNDHEFWAEATATWFGDRATIPPSVMKVILPDLYELLESYWGPPVE